MSSQLSQEDKMLLGEIDLKGNAIKGESMNDHTPNAKKFNKNESKGIIAMAGDPVPVDRAGKKVNNAKELPSGAPQAPRETDSKKRAASATAESSSEDTPIATKKTAAKKVKIDTDCGADTKEPKTPSPKKRASPKKKAVDPTIKTEADDHNGVAAHDDEPTTPSPTKKRSPTKKGQSVSPTKAGESTVRNTPRQRAAPAKAMAAPRGIPASWDTADDADKMLVAMKEKGEDWAAIREAWKEATGQDTANSTLPNRYARIKVNMMHLKEEDAVHLVAAKKEAEAEMWTHIATKMEAKGADKYATVFLQKQFKAFEEQAAVAALSVEAYVDTIATAECSEEAELPGHAIDAFVKKEGDEDVSSSE